MAKLIPIHPVHGDGFLTRLFGDTVTARAHAETLALHLQLVQRQHASPYSAPDLIDRLANHMLDLLPRPLPAPLISAIQSCARELVAMEAPLFSVPDLNPAPTAGAGHRTRALLRGRLEFFDHHQERVGAWLAALAKSLSRIVAAMPTIESADRENKGIKVPLISLLTDPNNLVSDIVANLLPFAPDANLKIQTAIPGAAIGEAICTNLLRSSNLTFDVAQRHPERLTFPGAKSGDANEIATSYLAGTPLQKLLSTPL